MSLLPPSAPARMIKRFWFLRGGREGGTCRGGGSVRQSGWRASGVRRPGKRTSLPLDELVSAVAGDQFFLIHEIAFLEHSRHQWIDFSVALLVWYNLGNRARAPNRFMSTGGQWPRLVVSLTNCPMDERLSAISFSTGKKLVGKKCGGKGGPHLRSLFQLL